MRRPAPTVLLAVALLLTAPACIVHIGSDGWQGDEGDRDARALREHHRRALAGLTVGMPRDAALARLETDVEPWRSDRSGEVGSPYRTEAFGASGTGQVEVRHYYTHVRSDDGRVGDDETTPVVFRDGVLVGWGPRALDAALGPR